MTLLRDFITFPPEILLELFFRVLFACACGALIGFERTRRFKEAGLRTHCIIAMAAALLMILSKYCFADLSVEGGYFQGDRGADPARIAAQIVSGVGRYEKVVQDAAALEGEGPVSVKAGED